MYPLLRPLLFALDPERAHNVTLSLLRTAGHLPAARLRGTPARVMGLLFPNRIGLAAGFDKNAVAVNGLGHLGFGSIEAGTVTPLPQAGNPRPRVFRFPSARAVVNRAGFPNLGAPALVERVRRERRYAGVLGISIGKNAVTPLDRAVDDYVSALRTVHPVADYIAVNISSPNTAQLRELHAPDRLEPLLVALLQARDEQQRGERRHVPLALKLSPDLDDEALAQVCRTAAALNLEGVIATNTTISRELLPEAKEQAGGASGAPLKVRSLERVSALRAALPATTALIGCGGVDGAEAARAMRAAGADIVQLYTALIFQGPAVVTDCLRGAP